MNREDMIKYCKQIVLNLRRGTGRWGEVSKNHLLGGLSELPLSQKHVGLFRKEDHYELQLGECRDRLGSRDYKPLSDLGDWLFGEDLK